MSFNDFIALPWMRWTVFFEAWLENVQSKIRFWFSQKDVMRIGVVGDLSMQDPRRLDRVLKEALANSDLVIQLGDMHPAYSVIEKHMKSGRLLVIPGNHDDRYDTMKLPRQWLRKLSNCTLVGLDNSNDRFNDETWDLLSQVDYDAARPIIVFAHKPLSNVVLPDGSENYHVMGESGSPEAKRDAERLKDWLDSQYDVLLCVGHWHGHSYMMATYSQVLIEGRGGAAPELGYTIITVTPDGMVLHSINLAT